MMSESQKNILREYLDSCPKTIKMLPNDAIYKMIDGAVKASSTILFVAFAAAQLQEKIQTTVDFDGVEYELIFRKLTKEAEK